MGLSQESAVPLYLQVAAEIRRDIAEGQVKPGRRLPPARDLAAVVGVNHNTMYRALRQLRDEGLLEFRRGRGITVTGEATGRSALVARCRELLGYSIGQGYEKQELLRIIERL
jgi:DNA-binding transcriptional regulator YhcF (GntR family)